MRFRLPPTTRPRRRDFESARRGLRFAGRGLLFTLGLCACSASVAETSTPAAVSPAELPLISIIIDDLGYRRLDGLRALELPGPVAYAVLPHTPYGSRLADIAFKLDKEVLLHVPMESELDKALGPGALVNGMAQPEIQAVLDAGLASVPHVSGLNNHMGSSLTQQAQAMTWVMGWMRENGGLYFVDSMTSAQSVALRSASDAGVRAIGRDVFLDASTNADRIREQFQRLVKLARERGTGLAIGHPYPETLSVLRNVLLKPSYYGVRLVPVRELIARRNGAAHARTRFTRPDRSARARYANNAIIEVRRQ